MPPTLLAGLARLGYTCPKSIVETAVAFYASCPHCKLPNLVEESAREVSMPCSACGKTFRPLRQTAQPTWTSPPTRPDPPPALRPDAKTSHQDIWAHDYLRKRDRPIFFLPGQQAGRTAQGLLTLASLMEFFHAMVACLMLTTAMNGGGGGFGSGWEVAGGGCLCLLFVFSIVSAVFFLVWVGYSYANLPSLGVTGLRFHPALVVLGFLIPVVNLFLPYLCMQELWRASEPNDPGQRWSDLSGSQRITVWWTFWVLSALCYLTIVGLSVASGLLVRGDWLHRPTVVTVYGMLNILGPTFTVAANVLLIGVIEDIIQRQSKKYLIHRELSAGWEDRSSHDFSD